MSKSTSKSSEDGVDSPRSSVDLSADPVSQSKTPDPEGGASGMVAMSVGDGETVEVNVEEVAKELVIPSDEGKHDAVKGGGGASGGEFTQKKSSAFYFYQCMCYSLCKVKYLSVV